MDKGELKKTQREYQKKLRKEAFAMDREVFLF